MGTTFAALFLDTWSGWSCSSSVHREDLTARFRNAGTSHGVSRKVSGNVGPHAGRAERLVQSEAVSWNFQSRSRRQRGGCRGNNGLGHLSCLAALPFAYNGSGGPASSGFLFTPLLSGDTSVPYKGPFVPSSLFLPTFNPLSLLLFLPLVSVSPRKQNTAQTMTTYSSPHISSALHHDFCISGCAPVSLQECGTGNLYALRLFVSEMQAQDENDSCIPHSWLGAGRIEPAHSPLLFWYLQRSDFTSSPSALRSSSPGSSLWHPRHHPCSIWTVT